MPIAEPKPNGAKPNEAPPKRSMKGLLAEFDALFDTAPEEVKAEVKPALTKMHAGIQQDSIWRKGREPQPFDEFVKTVAGVCLSARQYQAFNDAKMRCAADVVAADRPLQEIILMWGKGTTRGDDLIRNEATGEVRRADEWAASGDALVVKSLLNGKIVQMQAGEVFCKGKANLWDVVLADGRHVAVTADHRFMTSRGWCKLKDLRLGEDELLCTRQHGLPCDLKYPSTQDFQVDCRTLCRSCGEPVLRQKGSALAYSPSPGYAPAFVPCAPSDDLCSSLQHTCLYSVADRSEPRSYEDAYQPLARVGGGEPFLLESDISPLARQALDLFGSLPLEAKQSLLESFACLELAQCEDEWQFHFRAFEQRVRSGILQLRERSLLESAPQHIAGPQAPSQDSSLTSEDLSFVRVVDIIPQSSEMIYDLTVPVSHCYFDAQGVLHHNSGKDWLAALFIAYLAYIVCELAGDPAVFFGMAPFSQMSVLNVAPSEDLARQVFFRYLTQNVKHKLFDEYAPTILADEVRFSRKNPEDGKAYQFLCLYSKHSKSSGLDGYNLLGWVMDEADAFLDSADKSNADIVHNILRSSCNTRLKNRWVGLVISYPRVEGGFMMRLYDRATKEMASMGAKASFFADRAATWDVRPDVSREDPGIRADYENDPTSAAALYETIPATTIDAFFDLPERVDDAVDHARQPVAYVTTEPLDLPSEGKTGYFVRAAVGRIQRVPGHTYFMGGDAGLAGDAYAISVFHTDDATQAIGYLCPDCGADPTSRMGANYIQQPSMTRVPYNPDAYCGYCSRNSFELFGLVESPNQIMRLDGWWVRADVDAGSGEALEDGRGNRFDLPHVYEDLLVRVRPERATRPGEKNRPVYFPAVQTLCRSLIEELGVQQARFDPWNTAQVTQYLIESTGRDVDKISFSAPDQYRRARLVKAMLHAGKITLLPDEARDREWKRLRRVGSNKVDHPSGAGESKDIYDSESVAIWCAATSKCQQLEATWI